MPDFWETTLNAIGIRFCLGVEVIFDQAGVSDDARSLQSGIGPVFRHGFKCAGRQLDGNELFQLADPDALLFEVRFKGARHRFGDVLADAALFLGETTAVNFTAFGGLRVGDAAKFAHTKMVFASGAGTMEGSSEAVKGNFQL